MFVGRLTAEKGIRELTQAAVTLFAAGGSGIQWHFVGDGPLAAFVQESFTKAGLADCLFMHGSQDRATVLRLMGESSCKGEELPLPC